MSEPADEHDHPRESEGESHGDSSEHGHSRHGHGRRQRRRRRHKKPKPTSKVAVAVFVGLILIVGAGLFYALGPRLAQHLKAITTQQPNAGLQFVDFGRQTVIIMNPTEKNWGYTTVTLNDQYEAHAPEIPKGTQFEIWFKNLRGTNGEVFDRTVEAVKSVKIQPEGQEAISWTPPIE
jgi:hypothetical protein